jgi:hypothetical protein
MALHARSAYGSFQAQSARSQSNSGERALGRLDPFAAPFGYDRSLRIPAARSVGRERPLSRQRCASTPIE